MLRYQDSAFRAAFLVLGDATEAEDAVQDGFIRAYHALGRFRPDAPFRPWLLEIVANSARNRRRSSGRHERAVLRLASSEGASGTSPSPETTALAEEERAALLSAVNELDEQDRQAIACRYFLELSEAESASMLGVARGIVKSRLSRALSRLRERLARQTASDTLVEVNRG